MDNRLLLCLGIAHLRSRRVRRRVLREWWSRRICTLRHVLEDVSFAVDDGIKIQRVQVEDWLRKENKLELKLLTRKLGDYCLSHGLGGSCDYTDEAVLNEAVVLAMD